MCDIEPCPGGGGGQEGQIISGIPGLTQDSTSLVCTTTAQYLHETIAIVLRQECIQYWINTTVRIRKHLRHDLHDDHGDAEIVKDTAIRHTWVHERTISQAVPHHT